MLAAIATIAICLVGAGFGVGVWWLFRPAPTDPLNSDTISSSTDSTDTSSGSGDSGSGGGDSGD